MSVQWHPLAMTGSILIVSVVRAENRNAVDNTAEGKYLKLGIYT